MADTLKEFSAHSDKNYTNMTAGVDLVSTSASQKAVIKTVSFENPKGRNITVREGSVTGPLVASSSEKTGSFTGNEILDNSQSLVATTTDSVTVTGMVCTGWFESRYNHTALGNDLNKLRVYNTPAVSFGEYDGSDIATGSQNDYSEVPFSDSVGATKWTRNIRGASWSCTGKDGRFYWTHHTDNDHQIGGVGGTNRHTMYRVNGNSATSYSTVTGTYDFYWGGYDDERYIYYIGGSDMNAIKKYDTDPGGTNGNITTIQLYEENSTTQNRTNFDGDQYAFGSYFRDNYLLVNPKSDSSATNGCPTFIDVTTGYTKKLPYINKGFSDISGSNMRRSLGIGRDSSGDYWTVVGHYYDTSTSVNNCFQLTNLGNDPRTTFIPSGKTWKSTKTIAVGDNRAANRHAAVDGRRFGNPGGTMIHSPGVDRYMFLIGNRYQYESNASGNEHFVRLDLDNQSMPSFCKTIPGTFPAGCFRLTKDPTQADGAFGSISLRTTGILVT